MTEQSFSIIPPQELVQEWSNSCPLEHPNNRETYMATLGSQWGADRQLEACCDWLFLNRWDQPANELHAALRRKPLSLKEQALKALKREEEQWPVKNSCRAKDFDTIRRALEQLPD